MSEHTETIGIQNLATYFASTSPTFDDLNLTIEAYRVYMHLLRRSNGGSKESWSSYRDIGEHCFRATFRNVKSDTLRRKAMEAVAELDHYGLIRVVERKESKNPLEPKKTNNLTNLYFIIPPHMVDFKTPILKESYNIRRQEKVKGGESHSPGAKSPLTQSNTNEVLNTDNWEENATLLKEKGRPTQLITYSMELEGGETYETQNKTTVLSKLITTSSKPRKKKEPVLRELTAEQQQQAIDNYNANLPDKFDKYKGKSRNGQPLVKKAYDGLLRCINAEFRGDFDTYLEAAKRALQALRHTTNDFYRFINWDFVSFHTNDKVSEWDFKYDQIMQDFNTRLRSMSIDEIRSYTKDFDKQYNMLSGGYKFRDGKYYIFFTGNNTIDPVMVEWFSPEVCSKVVQFKDCLREQGVNPPPYYYVSPRFFRIVYWAMQGKCQIKDFLFDDKLIKGKVVKFPYYQSTDSVLGKDEFFVPTGDWVRYAKDCWNAIRSREKG